MKKSDIFVVLSCVLLVTGISGAKIYKNHSTIGTEKSYVLEICTPTYCWDQTFYNVKKTENKTDASGRKFIRVYLNDNTITDVSTEGRTVKVKK